MFSEYRKQMTEIRWVALLFELRRGSFRLRRRPLPYTVQLGGADNIQSIKNRSLL
jgi:hypothetical protein